MTYDFVTYNGERELMELRLNILDPYVDKFIVVEAKTTFSGNEKRLYFMEHERFFEKFFKKMEFYIIDEDYSLDEIFLAETSPNTQGAKHWKNEFLQKESIKKAMVHYKVQDEDIVYIGDCDEIWKPVDTFKPVKLKLKVYSYWLNNSSDEQFWGTLTAPYRAIKDKCLNHLRSDKTLYSPADWGDCGWHFTSMGGYKEVSRKLNDSYTTESYNTAEVQRLLPQRLKNGQDFLGRPFVFTLDEKDWPAYLYKNRYKYSHMCKTQNSPIEGGVMVAPINGEDV